MLSYYVASLLLLGFSFLYSADAPADSFLKLVSLDDALTYHDEKIVYFGIGTGTIIDSDKNSGRRVGRWQYLPTFMGDYIKKYPDLCACISCDGLWKKESVSSIEKRLESLHITEIVKKNPNIVRIVEEYISDTKKIEKYFETILKNGGVIIIANFAPLHFLLDINVLYNKLALKYSQAVCLIMFNHLWYAGAQFSLYDNLIMHTYADNTAMSRNEGIPYELFKAWNKNPQSSINFPWDTIINTGIEAQPFPYNRIKKYWLGQEDDGHINQEAARALGYNPDQPFPDKKQLLEDIALEKYRGSFVPSDYNFVVDMANPRFTLKIDPPKPNLANMQEFFPFTNITIEDIPITEFPKAFVEAVRIDHARYKNSFFHAKLETISEQLRALASAVS